MLWIKAFHIVFIASWFAGLFYLPRSFVNLAMVPPESVLALAAELTAGGADWQIHAYGNTLHAFTNPAANDPGFGAVYNADADRRSAQALHNFLAEVLA